jgi:formiminotetrahydrofolate cyclodeaminase
MASPRTLFDLTLAEWLEELATSQGIPGGGTALAVVASTVAAVLAMIARVSEQPALAAQAETLRARTAPLAQLDADTYEAALIARDTTEGLTPEQRDWRIGQAFAAAAEPPLEIARAGADLAELAAVLAGSGDPRVRADAIAAGALAAAVTRGAVALVEVNLTAVAGDPRIAEAEQLADAAERWASSHGRF